MIYRVHAAVPIRCMFVMKTLIASTNRLQGPENTEQTARKFSAVNVPLQRTLGTLGVRPYLLPTPWTFLLHEIKTCQDSTNSNNVSAMVIVQ